MKDNPPDEPCPPNPKPVTGWSCPLDVTASILSRLGAIEILNSAQNVCSQWRKICKDSLKWRSIDMHNSGDVWDLDYDLEKLCDHAVDRSCGHLIDINLEYFGIDKLLIHIAERSSHLVSDLYHAIIFQMKD